MDTSKELKAFTAEILRIRQLLQEGRRVTDAEHRNLEAFLKSLLLDLESNYKGGRKPN